MFRKLTHIVTDGTKWFTEDEFVSLTKKNDFGGTLFFTNAISVFHSLYPLALLPELGCIA